MKFIMENDDHIHAHSFLLFSHTPQMNNIHVPSSASEAITPATFNYGSFYGIEGENAGFPLKSDGSLYVMEALSRSQSQEMMPTSTPRPEMIHDQLSYYYSAFRSQNLMLGNYLSNHENDGAIMAYGDLQPLSLSMSPSSHSHSSCVTSSHGNLSPSVTESLAMDTNKKRGHEKVDQKHNIVHRKSIDTFGQRTSQYRGVTRHRWTGRYEAHLWDNSYKKEGQNRKGRQVYLGGYDMEEKAAKAYDLAALKYWGPSSHINFPLENYQKEIEEMKDMTRQEYVAHLRRKSSGFSRGASMYRGVTRHHQHGRWQARIGRVAGNKDLYLGTFSSQEEAAEAYDVAAIKFRGLNAVTNFNISRYDVQKIMGSSKVLSGEEARRNNNENSEMIVNYNNNNIIIAMQNQQAHQSSFVEILQAGLSSPHTPLFAAWIDA